MSDAQWDGAVAITVTYRSDGEWHLFTSDQIDGLCVASQNLEMAFDDVPVAVQGLLKLDHDVDCKVEWTLTYTGFRQKIHMAEKAQEAVEQRTQEMMDDSIVAFPIDPHVEQHLHA